MRIVRNSLFLLGIVTIVCAAGAQERACKQGFVPREAYAGDTVCVTPETRAQVVADNRAAAQHKVGNSDSCLQGYVWRQATAQDHVCVSYKTRDLTAEDNRAAEMRYAAGGATMREVNNGVPLREGNAGQQRMLPGFHVVTNVQAEFPHLGQSRVPRLKTAPLPENEVVTAVARLGFPVKIILPPPYAPNIHYQLEQFNNQITSAIDTTEVTDSLYSGADGYIEIDFNTQPGSQYLLDCSLGEDGTYKIGTTFVENGGGPGFSSGMMSSFNKHLLIPLNPTPSNAQSARVVVGFSSNQEIAFNGCQVDTVQ